MVVTIQRDKTVKKNIGKIRRSVLQDTSSIVLNHDTSSKDSKKQIHKALILYLTRKNIQVNVNKASVSVMYGENLACLLYTMTSLKLKSLDEIMLYISQDIPVLLIYTGPYNIDTVDVYIKMRYSNYDKLSTKMKDMLRIMGGNINKPYRVFSDDRIFKKIDIFEKNYLSLIK